MNHDSRESTPMHSFKQVVKMSRTLYVLLVLVFVACVGSRANAADDNNGGGNCNPCCNVVLKIDGPTEMRVGQATEYTATVAPQVDGHYAWTIHSGEGGFDNPSSPCNGTSDSVFTDCIPRSVQKVVGTRPGDLVVRVIWTSCDPKYCDTFADITIKVLPSDGGELRLPKIPLGAKNRRADVHGVPMPDPSPTGEGESDRTPNQAYTDMFTLAPTYSVSDAALRAEGGEMLVEFRRTTSIQARNIHPDITRRGIHFPTADLLGLGWDVNPVSNVRIHLRQDESGINYLAAYAQDETGGSFEYESSGTNAWVPDVRHSYNASAFKAQLTQPTDTTFVLKKAHGTTYYYTYATTFIDPISRFSACAATLLEFEKYYRLDKIVDRNGNTIRFDYYGNVNGSSPAETDASIIPKRIWEEGHPERFISINASYHPEWYDVGLDGGWRIHSIVDGLNRQTTYSYGPSGGMPALLTTVTKPAVEDPAATTPGSLVQPTASFSYHIQDLPDSVLDPLHPPQGQQGINRWCAVSGITDARGHTTSMTFAPEWFPSEVYAVLNSAIWTQRIRVASMTTVDGTATFSTAVRQPTQVTTTVTDTRGVAVSFAFTGVQVAAPTSTGNAIFITKCVRSGGGGTTTFDWSADACGNLMKVTDMSNNVIQFEYTSGAGGDQFDLPIDPTKPYDPILNPRKYAGLDKPAKRTVDPAGLNIVTAYRYDPKFAKLIKTTDAENRVTDEILDTKGNRLEIDEELGKKTKYTYSTTGDVLTQTDPDGRKSTFAYTFAGSLNAYRTVTQDVIGYGGELSLKTVTISDVVGNKRSMKDPRGFTYLYEVDALDRVTKETAPAILDPSSGTDQPTLTLKGYDLNGNLIKLTDAEGNVTTYTYDLMNRQLSQRRRMVSPTADNAADIVTSSTYTAVGQVSSTKDGNGNVSSFEYDGLLRLVTKQFPPIPRPDGAGTVSYKEGYEYGPNSGSGAFAYWSGWNPTRVINKRGYPTDTVYDAIYRPIRTIRRTGTDIAFNAPPRAGEPTTEMIYNKVHQVTSTTQLNESGGAVANQSTYTYYDDLYRPTVVVKDLGDGPNQPIGTTVNNGASFPAGSLNIIGRTAYDLAGNVIRTADALGRVTTSEFDGASRVTKTDLPAVATFDPIAGTTVPTLETVYDDNGNKVRVKDVRGTWTKNEFDAQNRATLSIVDLNGDGGFSGAVNGDDIVTATIYNRIGTPIAVTDSRGNTTKSLLDRAYRVIGVVQPVVHDAISNTDSAPSTSSTLDKNGNVTFFTDAKGNVVHKYYDGWNQVILEIIAANDASGTPTSTYRDGNGNVTTLIMDNVADIPIWYDGSSPTSAFHPGTGDETTTYTYDAFDRKLTETLPAVADGIARVSTNAYDRIGNVISTTDPKGQVSVNAYDLESRVLQVQRKPSASAAPAEVRAFSYSKTSKMLTASDLHGATAYVYDAHDRISTETRATVGEVAYTTTSAYDLAGNRTRVTYPVTGRIVLSGYDRANRLISSTDQATGAVTACVYDPLGNRLTKSTTGATGTVSETASYDALNRIATSLNATPARTLFAATYGYDLVGNRVTALETQAGQASGDIQAPANLVVLQRSYTYDAQYRLTQERTLLPAQPSRVLQEDFGYDAAGNRVAHTMADSLFATKPTVTEVATYDALNRLLAIIPTDSAQPSITCAYDLNGNLLTKVRSVGGTVTVSVAHTWDVWNRLVASNDSSQGGTMFEAAYDYRTRRIYTREGPELTRFRYDGGDCFQEFSGQASAAMQTEHIRGGGLGGGIGGIIFSDRRATGGTLEQFSYNPVGNTVALTDPTGGLSQATTFGSFGNALNKVGASKNNRLANTKERSFILGLDNHGFRYYDPEIGRYISRDPSGYGDGLNVYLYVHNNPINRIDLQGLIDLWELVQKVAQFANPGAMVTNAVVHEVSSAYESRREDGHGVMASAGLAVSNLAGEVVPVNSVYRLATGTETVTGERTGLLSKGLDVVTLAASVVPLAGLEVRAGATAVKAEARAAVSEVRAAVAATEGAAETTQAAKVGTAEVGAEGASGWKGPTDYSHIPDPKNVNASTKPTPRQVREMKKANAEHNDGVLRDDKTGEVMVQEPKSKRGVVPPSNGAQVDHIDPVANGGTRTMSNLELRTRANNRAKSDKVE